MFFIILAVVTSTIVFSYLIHNRKSKIHYCDLLYALIAIFLLFIAIGWIYTDAYFQYGNTIIHDTEVKLHPVNDIDLNDYISQDKIIVLDIDHIRTKYAKGLHKFFALQKSRTEYALELGDWWFNTDD